MAAAQQCLLDNDSSYAHNEFDTSKDDSLLYDFDEDGHEDDCSENNPEGGEGDNRTLPGVCRSGRKWKKPTYLHDFMHFSIAAEDVEMPVTLHDEMHALGAIMI